MSDRSSGRLWMILAIFGVTGCGDKAKPDYDECVHQASNDNFGAAVLRCQAAISADPASSAGKAAADKLREIQPKLDAVLADEKATKEQALMAEAEQKVAKAKADADVKAKQDAADAACKKWATICATGGGLQFFAKKAECEDMTSGIAKVGVKCDPCKCFE